MAFTNVFRKKDKKAKQIKGGSEEYSFTHIYNNDAISLVHDACVICVNGKKERTTEDKVKFISDKVKLGHESILEHSNYIVKINIKGDYTAIQSLHEMMHCFKYLNVKCVMYETDDSFYYDYDILIGGSVRGFKHIIRTIQNPSNPLYVTIIKYIKRYIHSCFFSDMIEDDIFNQMDFLDDLSQYENKSYRDNLDWGRKGAFVLAYDDLEKLTKNPELKGFSRYDLADFAVVNTVFVNVSRACSHQLVRHRAGITQLSQRYVSMKDAPMILPKAINDVETACVLEDILNVYNGMIEEGIKKEDARYILPNACSTSLYMTFTYRGFIKAFKLRTGKGAQQEIKDLFNSFFNQIPIDLDIILPYYMYAELLPKEISIDFNEIPKSIELDNVNNMKEEEGK